VSAPAPGPDNRPLQESLARLSGFFEVRLLAHDERLPAPWRPFDARTDLAGRISAVRDALTAPGGPVPGLRVSASVTHLGLVARIVAADLAVRALTTGAERLDLTSARWQDEIGGPFPFACEVTASTTTISVDPLIVAVTARIAESYRVSQRVLWGNVASTLNSAAVLLASTRPDLADLARHEADRLLADVRLEGGGLRSGPGFRRKSCCLMYHLATPGKPVCGDCILARE
jgi:hypothetical protein